MKPLRLPTLTSAITFGRSCGRGIVMETARTSLVAIDLGYTVLNVLDATVTSYIRKRE